MRGLANLAERTLHTNSPSVLIRTYPYPSVHLCTLRRGQLEQSDLNISRHQAALPVNYLSPVGHQPNDWRYSSGVVSKLSLLQPAR